MTESGEEVIEYAFRNIVFLDNNCNNHTKTLDSNLNSKFLKILKKIGKYEVIDKLQVEHPYKEIFMYLVTVHKDPVDLKVIAANNYAYVIGDKQYVDEFQASLKNSYLIKVFDMPNYCWNS